MFQQVNVMLGYTGTGAPICRQASTGWNPVVAFPSPAQNRENAQREFNVLKEILKVF